MTKEEIKQVFDNVQQQLETLQGSEASFMFIGHQGNHFAIAGQTNEIGAQILFAMMRYPVIRDIIKDCAASATWIGPRSKSRPAGWYSYEHEL